MVSDSKIPKQQSLGISKLKKYLSHVVWCYSLEWYVCPTVIFKDLLKIIIGILK